ALQREGRDVTVLDQGEPGCGSSHGNCGTITPSHAHPLAAPGQVLQALRWMLRRDAPLYVRPRWDPALFGWLARFALRCNRRDWDATTRTKAALLLRSRRLLEELLRSESLDCAFEASGLWYVFRDPAVQQRFVDEAAGLAGLGIAAEQLERGRALAEEPALCGDTAGVVSFPGDAMLRPDRLVAELARRLRELGGRIECGQQVERLAAPGGGVRCTTQAGEWRARQLLLCGGAWSAALGRQLRLPPPVQPGKGDSITYRRPARSPRRPLVPKERSGCAASWSG